MVPYKAFWYLFMFVPKSALTCMKTVKKTVSKLKRLVSKRSYITRYAYHAYCKKHPVIKGQVLIESFRENRFRFTLLYRTAASEAG